MCAVTRCTCVCGHMLHPQRWAWGAGCIADERKTKPSIHPFVYPSLNKYLLDAVWVLVVHTVQAHGLNCMGNVNSDLDRNFGGRDGSRYPDNVPPWTSASLLGDSRRGARTSGEVLCSRRSATTETPNAGPGLSRGPTVVPTEMDASQPLPGMSSGHGSCPVACPVPLLEVNTQVTPAAPAHRK